MYRICVIALLLFTSTTPAGAQAVQAFTNLTSTDSVRRGAEMDRALARVDRSLARMQELQPQVEFQMEQARSRAESAPAEGQAAIAAQAQAVAVARVQAQVQNVMDAADRLRAARNANDVDAFRRELRNLRWLEDRAAAAATDWSVNARSQPAVIAEAARAAQEIDQARLAIAASGTVPQAAIRVPDVAFVAGGGVASARNQTLYDLGISSNLLGTLAGNAFDVFSSGKFGEYLKNNISVGASLPLDRSKRITAEAGIGLGGLNLGGRATLWPVLSIVQTDTVDPRIPRDLVRAHTDHRDWSAPAMSFAFIPVSVKTFDCRVRQGKVVPIIVPSLRLPFFYPGNAFEAIAGLFTDNRRNYERSGHVEFSLSVSVPLLKVTTPEQPKQDDNNALTEDDPCKKPA